MHPPLLIQKHISVVIFKSVDDSKEMLLLLFQLFRMVLFATS